MILYTSLGGTTYAWDAPGMLAAIVGRRRAARAVPVRRVARRGADPAARALPQPDLPDDERDRLHHRVRALRVGHVRPALPAGRQGAQPDRVGAADDADDGRPARDRDRERPADLTLRALPPVPDHRHGRRNRRALPPLPARGGDPGLGGGRVPADPRPRARPDDAGARARRPERGRLPAARRRDVGRRRSPVRSAARSASPSSARSSRTGSATSSLSALPYGVHAPAHGSLAAVQHLPPAIHAAYSRRTLPRCTRSS